jgi:hypothetical protein
MPESNVTENPSFSDNYQVVWDTISTGALKKCPRYYQLSIREGWEPKGNNPHIFFGLVCHSAFETYERAKVDGNDHEASMLEAVRYALTRTGEYKKVAQCLNKKCGAYRDFIEEVPQQQLICYHCNGTAFRNYENKFVPWLSDNKNKNRWTLLRTIVWYLDHYADSAEDTVILEDGSPAVEVWFRFPLPIQTPGGTSYMLTGHIDKLVRYNDGLWFRDLKTTKNTIRNEFFEQYSPDNQMSQYHLGGQVTLSEPLMGGIIDAAQVAIDFTRFQRGFVDRTKAQMEEWLKDIQYWIKQAEHYADEDWWPMNDTACHHYGGCAFRGICNKDPSIRGQFLKTHFKKRTWNPLEKRE